MKEKMKFDLILIGYYLSVSFSIVTVFTFMCAYFQGYKTTVFVNVFGEAHLEFIVILPITIVIIVGMVLFTKEYRKKYVNG